MKWEELTYRDIEKMDKNKTVVILPIGCIEVHGPHLPLGTDTITIYYVALKAAERESAVVLPPLYYAYVPENRNFNGTISLRSDTFLNLLEDILDEISRQGFKKFLILNGHGGNRRPLSLFLRKMLEKNKRIELYILNQPWGPIMDFINEIKETRVVEHAGEIETSMMLYLTPNLVKLDRVKGEAKLGKRWIVPFLETMVDWQRYAYMGYVGDPRKGSREKGEKILNYWIEVVARIIKKIKDEEEYRDILEKYYRDTGI